MDIYIYNFANKFLYTLCAQVHKWPQNHSGDNQENALFS